jgi:hypothetical protein
MSFKIRIEENVNTTAIELKGGKLGYSRPVGNSQFEHTPLTQPFVIDFPNLQHGYVKYEKGKQAQFVVKSYQEQWTDEDHALMKADGYRTVYLVPVATREIPSDRKQELRCYDLSITEALSDAHDKYLEVATNGMIPLVQHQVDTLGVHSLETLQYVPRPIERFGEPLVKHVIPFPKPESVSERMSPEAKRKADFMDMMNAKIEATKRHSTYE